MFDALKNSVIPKWSTFKEPKKWDIFVIWILGHFSDSWEGRTRFEITVMPSISSQITIVLSMFLRKLQISSLSPSLITKDRTKFIQKFVKYHNIMRPPIHKLLNKGWPTSYVSNDKKIHWRCWRNEILRILRASKERFLLRLVYSYLSQLR